MKKNMCPSCKSSQVRRSRTNHLRDKILRWVGLCPYRCRDCNRRFYLNHYEDEKLFRELKRDKQRLAEAVARRASATSTMNTVT